MVLLKVFVWLNSVKNYLSTEYSLQIIGSSQETVIRKSWGECEAVKKATGLESWEEIELHLPFNFSHKSQPGKQFQEVKYITLETCGGRSTAVKNITIS